MTLAYYLLDNQDGDDLITPSVWIATGGKNGCKWKEKDIAKVLLNREQPIYLFPDLNAIE